MTYKSYKSFAVEKPDGEIGIFEAEEKMTDHPTGLMKSNRISTDTIITEPEAVELPRKGNNFRTVMERKLGIDWEHSIKEDNELEGASLQTNEM